MDSIYKDLRKICLRLANKCQDGNLQSTFSCIEIIWTLYDKVMNWTSENATSDDRDFFIISKGQATFALFASLIKKGFFKEQDMENIGSFDSIYSNQTDVTKFNGGVENSAGSLGHGFPIAVGIAIANKIKKLSSNVFVLTGDGEFNEGTMWESCIIASNKKLDNLTVIIDDNDSVKAMVKMGDMKSKLECFNFDVYIVDGHNPDELEYALKIPHSLGKPKAIIAKTIRGYGSKTMLSDSIWFHKSPNDIELIQMLKEVDEL